MILCIDWQGDRGSCLSENSGPARGFGYTVSGALLIQVYGIFCHNSGIKYIVFSGF